MRKLFDELLHEYEYQVDQHKNEKMSILGIIIIRSIPFKSLIEIHLPNHRNDQNEGK